MRVLLYGTVPVNRIELLQGYLTTRWELDPLPDTSDRSAARRHVAEADALIGITFESDLTDAAGRLKLIHVTGAGYDAFDPQAIPAGCVLCNVFEHEVPIAEYVMLNVLLHVTRQAHYSRTMPQGDWEGSGRHDGATHDEAMGKTIGIVGYGHIGREVARRAKAFGMKTLAVRRNPAADEHLDWCGGIDQLDRLLGESDFVVLALPQTPQSTGMIGEAQLRRMKPTGYLINPARAHIIDEKALFRALKEKWFAGAALDAQYQYPPSIRVRQRGWTEPFHELENVTLTPHFSAWTGQLLARRWKKIAENLDRLHRGEEPHRIVIDKRRT